MWDLLVPHVMRMLFGTDYRMLIPTSAIGGAIAIVVADTLARTLVAPTELPVGAMTALAGRAGFYLPDAPEDAMSCRCKQVERSTLPQPTPPVRTLLFG